MPRTDDPVADLLALGAAYRANARANPHLYELMFGRAVPEFQPDAAVAERIRPTFDALIDACARCVASGAFADAGPYDIAVQLNSMAHGLASLELRGALGDEAEADAHWKRALTSLAQRVGLSAQKSFTVWSFTFSSVCRAASARACASRASRSAPP